MLAFFSLEPASSGSSRGGRGGRGGGLSDERSASEGDKRDAPALHKITTITYA